MTRPKILVIDDNAELALRVQALLEIEGYEVIIHTSVVALPYVVRRECPDLVLLGVSLPIVSAEQALTRVPPSSWSVRAPLILFSGIGEADLAMLARNVGADAYLSKGLDVAELLREIEKWTRGSLWAPVRRLLVEKADHT